MFPLFLIHTRTHTHTHSLSPSPVLGSAQPGSPQPDQHTAPLPPCLSGETQTTHHPPSLGQRPHHPPIHPLFLLLPRHPRPPEQQLLHTPCRHLPHRVPLTPPSPRQLRHARGHRRAIGVDSSRALRDGRTGEDAPAIELR